MSTDAAQPTTLAGKCVFVTGGTGAIGPTVVHALQAQGANVRALVMDDADAARLPWGVEAYPGDIRQRDTLSKAMGDADIVVHMAAKLHVNNPDPSLRDEYTRINVDGTRNVAELAAERHARLVHFSTICVYGSSTPPTILNEDAPLHCDTLYAQTKRQSEQIALDTTSAVVLRMAAIYGPTMKGNYVRLTEALQSGRFAMIGSGSNRRTLVFIEDVANAVTLAAGHPDAPGQIYNVSDGCVHTLAEIIDAIRQAIGAAPRWNLRVPQGVALTAAHMLDAVLRVAGKPSKFHPLVDKFLEDMAVSSHKIQTNLGFAPQVGLHEGWKRSVSESVTD